jgi:hypothetical protein
MGILGRYLGKMGVCSRSMIYTNSLEYCLLDPCLHDGMDWFGIAERSQATAGGITPALFPPLLQLRQLSPRSGYVTY